MYLEGHTKTKSDLWELRNLYRMCCTVVTWLSLCIPQITEREIWDYVCF